MASPARSPLVPALLAALVAILAPGCGPPQSVDNAPEHYDMGMLEEVGGLYNATYQTRKKPPASIKDFVPSTLNAGGANAVKKGEVVVYWGVAPTPEEPSGEILAYTSEVPAKGGYVLLKDMTIKAMTPEEFQAAPKPAGPTSADAKPDAKVKKGA